MSWIIVQANGEELRRLELTAPVTVGRSAECEISVRDILLSRTHCRIEPVGAKGSWRVIDLGSKNGTRVGWQKATSHVLRDGDWLRMGRTRITFHVGAFEPAPAGVAPRADRLIRPADPHEALTGTVTDFVLDDEETARNDEDGVGWGTSAPFPQPRPVDPNARYDASSSENLLEQLAQTVAASSASRDGGDDRSPAGIDVDGLEVLPEPVAVATAVREVARRPRRALPKVTPIFREIGALQQDEADLSLQADPRYLPVQVAAPVAKTWSWKKRVGVGALLAVGVSAATGVVGMSAWLLTMAK